MKINKIISLVLTTAMSVATLSVPVALATDVENVTDERVIYEDNFDNYTGFSALPGNFPVRGNIFTEYSQFTTESKYSKYELLTDENDPTNKFIQLDSAYNNQYNQYHPTNIEYLSDEALFTKEKQMQIGNLKLSFSFCIDGVGEKHEAKSYFKVVSAETMDYSLIDDKFTMFNIIGQYFGSEIKYGIQMADSYYEISEEQWYDVEMVYDLIGNNLNTNVTNKSNGEAVCNFNHKIDWYDPFKYFPVGDPEGSREYNAIQNVLFKTTNGLMTSIDDFKLEYYVEKPEISPKDIVVTDYRGMVVEDADAVSPAVVSIKLPFGTIMSEESTNEETVILKDSEGNPVAYVPEYSHNAYILKFSDCLNTNEKYTLYIPETVENIIGDSLGREVTYSFTTTDKTPEFMAIEAVKTGDVDVTGLDDITNGATIDVYLEYANNSGKEIGNLVCVSYYDDDMLVYTESVKGEIVPPGGMGAKTVPFTVPSSDVVNLDKVDKISVCLWESFANSIAYVEAFDIGDDDEKAVAVTAKYPVVTYSYNKSVMNIQGAADKDSKYVTVQILKPDSSFDNGDSISDAEADAMVLYRGQADVKDGAYSVDIRFDDKQNVNSTLESGVYPARIFVDGNKLDIDEVYINSYPDFVAGYEALNDAAKNGDFTEFKRIINDDRQMLNFGIEFAENDTLDEELAAYFDYVKENSLDTNDELENTQTFKTYVTVEYIKKDKLDDVQNYIDELAVDEKLKELCSKMLYDDEVGAYFNKLISGKNIKDFDELEDEIKEALILTVVKYGNGYGDLKTVLEKCGDAIGIDTPVSTTACKALIGKTYKDGSEFKTAYKKSISQSSDKGSSTGGKGGSGGGGGGSSSFNLGAVKIENVTNTKPVPVKKEFDDIDNYEWAVESILGLADRGIINGVSDTKFSPSRNVNREEFAKIITGALKMTDYEYGGNIFADASNSDWFTSYINIVADLGIARGVGDGCFGVGQNIKRQDMAVMIYNALVYRGVDMVSGELHFEDSNEIADYAKTAVSALYNMGAINGVSETAFEPNSFATRAEAAKMIYGVLGKLQG